MSDKVLEYTAYMLLGIVYLVFLYVIDRIQ